YYQFQQACKNEGGLKVFENPELVRELKLGKGLDRYEAESILKDLADNLQEERPGRLSREFLNFDFPFTKASRLLLKGEIAAAEKTIRDLMKKNLTEEQMVAAQRFLDGAGTTSLINRKIRKASLISAANIMRAHLSAYYANWGQYPNELNSHSLELISLHDNEIFNKAVSSIENYTSTHDDFSLILVGKDTSERIRLTQNGIAEITTPGRQPIPAERGFTDEGEEAK
ncbi:MAG: hypothetical protein M0036_13800, partial [Desulfobacteraceae bacterium]|nr:hypothetical protein [Desulfobacteraceae bacterium]